MPPKDAAAQGTSGGGGGHGGDRLSSLRDEVLFRVMSHLKAWEAVRTCVLSKRWRNLWSSSSADFLDIRQPCLCRGGGGGPAHRLQAREEKFAAFVANLLLRRRRVVPLDSLRLCWSHETVHGDANTWIAHAVRRGVVEIELSGKHHNEYPSPEYMSFIACDNDTFKIRLKILKLIHIRLDDTTLTQLCSRCTCLEELELKDCFIPQKTKIQSTLLNHLTIIKCQIPRGLSVYAPSLSSLEFSRNIGYVPWIQNLGLLAASNINHWAPHKYPEYPGLGSCNLKILKFSRVKLDNTTLAQLCSVCTSLEELVLKDCLVVGKEIRSNSLRYLAMINCQFTIEPEVRVPNLLSLRCTRPFRHVPRFQYMEFLVTAIVALDDTCMSNDSQWTWGADDKDESDHDGDFFAHFGAKDSGDDSDDESYQDEDDESDHDGDHLHSGAEDSDYNSDNEYDRDEDDESDHDGELLAHSGAEDSQDNSNNEPDQDEQNQSDHDSAHSIAEESDNSNAGIERSDENNKDESYLDDNIFADAGAEDFDDSHSCSGPGYDVNGLIVGYDEIAEEYNGDCGGMFGGDGMLCSLSNVRTMNLSAHSGEVLFIRELKSCTDFKNLKTLSLGEWCITPDFDVLASILQHSPNLENLYVQLDMANKRRVGFNPRPNLFVCTNLRKVEITYCKHDKMVHILAELFRVNSITWKKIFVHRTACTCDVKSDTDSRAKRKAQNEAGERPAKQIKA